jgi:hypothetical protein
MGRSPASLDDREFFLRKLAAIGPDFKGPCAGHQFPVILEAIAEIEDLPNRLHLLEPAFPQRFWAIRVGETGAWISVDEFQGDFGARRLSNDLVFKPELDADPRRNRGGLLDIRERDRRGDSTGR